MNCLLDGKILKFQQTERISFTLSFRFAWFGHVIWTTSWLWITNANGIVHIYRNFSTRHTGTSAEWVNHDSEGGFFVVVAVQIHGQIQCKKNFSLPRIWMREFISKIHDTNECHVIRSNFCDYHSFAFIKTDPIGMVRSGLVHTVVMFQLFCYVIYGNEFEMNPSIINRQSIHKHVGGRW